MAIRLLNNLVSYKRNQPITALDIGTSSVKALQIVRENGSVRVLNYGIGKTIEQATQSLQGSLKRVNISVSGQSVIIRYIELPKMTREELSNALQFEAEKHISIPLDQAMLDFNIIEELKENKQRILLVACKKELIDSRIELLKNLNISANLIDVDSLALANGFLYITEQTKEDGIFALINIGAKFTNLHILAKNNSYLIRDIQIAGDNITRVIAAKFAISIGEAEDLKQNITPNKEKEILYTIRPVIENMAEELRLSFDYFENLCGKTIDKVFISGGCCNLKGLDNLLKDELNIDIARWNPLGLADFSNKPEFAVAAGLALRK